MATKDSRRAAKGQPKARRTASKSDPEESAQPQQTAAAEDIKDNAAGAEEALPPPPPGLPKDYPRQGRPTIRKGVYLSALIYIEGDSPPAQDFTTQAKSTLQKLLNDTFAKPHDDLNISLKRITVQNNIEDEEPDIAASKANQKEDTFDF